MVTTVVLIIIIVLVGALVCWTLYNWRDTELSSCSMTKNQRDEVLGAVPLFDVYKSKGTALGLYLIVLINNPDDADALIKSYKDSQEKALLSYFGQDQDKTNLVLSLEAERMINIKKYHLGEIQISELERQTRRINKELSKSYSLYDGYETNIEDKLNECSVIAIDYYDALSSEDFENTTKYIGVYANCSNELAVLMGSSYVASKKN